MEIKIQKLFQSFLNRFIENNPTKLVIESIFIYVYFGFSFIFSFSPNECKWNVGAFMHLESSITLLFFFFFMSASHQLGFYSKYSEWFELHRKIIIRWNHLFCITFFVMVFIFLRILVVLSLHSCAAEIDKCKSKGPFVNSIIIIISYKEKFALILQYLLFFFLVTHSSFFPFTHTFVVVVECFCFFFIQIVSSIDFYFYINGPLSRERFYQFLFDFFSFYFLFIFLFCHFKNSVNSKIIKCSFWNSPTRILFSVFWINERKLNKKKDLSSFIFNYYFRRFFFWPQLVWRPVFLLLNESKGL